MQIGKLDQRIELQSYAEVNNFGSLTASWNTIATVWGRVLSQRGSEAFEAARTNAKEAVRIQLRLRSDVDEKCRLIWLDKVYNIIHVDKSQHRRGEMWITAELST